LKVCIANSL